MLVFEGAPVIRNNTIDAPGTGGSTGVSIANTNGPAGGTLSRNTITGLDSGVAIGDTPLPVSLDSDVITGSVGHGLQANDFGGNADFSATNVTIYDSGLADIRLEDNVMTLDSSIVGNAISANGTAMCAISFSRGPTLLSGPNGCGAFQTTADPMFANPAIDNYHLLAASPMIDTGNTLAPPPGSLDVDGDPRALSKTPSCTAPDPGRRDIGADEFVAGKLDCIAPDTAVSGKRKVKAKKKRARVALTLTATEAGATFECSIDGGPFLSCASPFVTRLRRGRHTLAVRAKDASGNLDTSPASHGIKIVKKKRR